MDEQLERSHPKTIDEMLRESLLFREVDEATIQFVSSQLQTVAFKKGEPIALEGEVSDHVYFIKSGSVEIVKYRPETQQVTRVTVLKEGHHFSEFSVLNHSNKSASAFAFEDCELYRLDGDAFLKVLHEVPVVGHHLATRLAEFNYNSVADSFLEYFDQSSIAFSPEIRTLLPTAVWKKFGVLPLNFNSGTLLVALKDPSRPEFYDHIKSVLGTSKLNVVMISEGDFESTLKYITGLYDGTRAPTKAPAPVPLPTPLEGLKRSQYFAELDEKNLAEIAQFFETVEYKPGDVIYSPGGQCEYFYIFLGGRIELSRPSKKRPGVSHLIRRDVREGLSEVFILFEKPFSDLARAAEATTLLRLKKSIFVQFLKSGIFCLNLSKVLARRLQVTTDSGGLKFYDGTQKPDLSKVGKLMPAQVMQHYQMIPLLLEDNEMTLGTVSPSVDAVCAVAGRYLRGYRLNLVLITAESFKQWLTEATAADGQKATVQVAKAVQASGGDAPNATVLELNKLLINGFTSGASDLHLEPTGSGYCVRYRIDGVLQEVGNKIAKEAGDTILNRIKVISKLDITNRMTPQDGQLRVSENNIDMTARVATVPTRQGEGAVLRLIRSRNSAVPLSMLAPDTRVIKLMKGISKIKQGLFLVTGPTGSGKTTTLYSLIGELNRVDVKIVTLEDPVELEIAGVTQIEISDKTGLTFAKGLKSSLRQDPDIMVVGEIRDEESARTVFEAALSGHLVVSTLHTNNAFAIKSRLKELGVPMGTMASGLVGAMAQRLVRRVCKKCEAWRPITSAEHMLLQEKLHMQKVPTELKFGRGCHKCNQTGYAGRLAIMEVWRKDRGMEDLILKDAKLEEMLEYSRIDGYLTMYEFGLKMAVNGLTTIEEVERCMAGNM
jgi:type II secretory ATPase GspE/PulE/Tfp pilus assembly ATPase PilB-like protein